MRADAARRRAALIRAARRLFALHGRDIALDAVAEAADVGIATLYRNFSSRAALAEEVALAILDDVHTAADEALDRMSDDPAAAWHAYVRRLVQLDLGALSAALTEHLTDDMSAHVRIAQTATLAGVGDLLEAARAAGLVRHDLEPLDLVLGIGLITRPLPEPVARDVPDLVPRMLDIVLAGMRPDVDDAGRPDGAGRAGPQPGSGSGLAVQPCVWLTTLRPDGSPHVTPVWFLLDGDTFWIASSTVNVKVANMERDPRVAIAVDGSGSRPVVAEGHAYVDRDIHAHAPLLARFAAKYDGWDAADERQDGPRVMVEVRVDRWLLRPDSRD
ncbi:TIGR03618 family F420-dependent PPOX class oxidoreductase [Cellulomonas xiejunii]|uniref:TIGR03618 family F420-dependent PPOX class oxidoreductase n=1 Tax=Cellulomonas xiejunii TaxID=2968083 RepID=A0ABY5KIJ1_9CELL|nr:TIGR03618 family F420-dependent PPOX class oxidoreductase [Cellulomonas xiejunii]MCC2313281.1 TIGR03618 family F420-dependent PPOX class oxidoreductase [Cellulomonas xiejunii]MCC2319973.1 TIGR03618 family F420-dependent PPOX class oxidoreductase [Cellulomonas xiejunii]UUI70292.1 TIGR03618 family F420-dependent PPOX class oxidoreductase [Cellulomonas xiejunii]